MIIAKYVHPENGTEYDHRLADSLLSVGAEYKVSNIIVGQSYTGVLLFDYTVQFNSVLFDFYENGHPVDIYQYGTRWF